MRIHTRSLCLFVVLVAVASWAVAAETPAKAPTLELYPTPLAVGLEVACGDDAATASAEFVWRVKGEDKWRSGVDMTYDRAKGLIWASIWPLEQGTTVEVKVAYKAAPTAAARTLEDTVTTRTLILENKGGSVYYVSPAGDDANPGTKEKPFRTLAIAAGKALPGDTVYAMTGVYKEHSLFGKLSGTAEKPIIFAAAPGEKPVIDGSVTIEKGKGAWTETGNGIYEARLDAPIEGQGYLAENGKRVFRYMTLEELRANKLGVPRAWFYDDKNAKLFVMSTSGKDPNASEYKAAFWNHGVALDASQYVVLKGFEVRYFGETCVRIAGGARGCIVIDNVLHHAPGAVMMQGYTTTDNSVWRNDMYDEGLVDFTWSQIKASDYRRQGLTCATGRGSSICYNKVHEFFDCLDPETWQMVEFIERNRDLDVMYNELYNCGDDAIEADGGGVNMRIHGNRMRNVFAAISIAPIERGPVYVTRNDASYKQLMFKLNVGQSDSRGWAFCYHNSGYCLVTGDVDGGTGISFPRLGYIPLANKVFRNNAIIARSYGIIHNSANYSLDYDCFFPGPGQKPLRFTWDSVGADGETVEFSTRDFGEYVKTTGSEVHGMYADPRFVSTPDIATVTAVHYEGSYPSQGPMVKDTAVGDLRLESTSPCVDKGLLIRGINEDFRGKGPDIGAFETR